jgi:hypothetical protein
VTAGPASAGHSAIEVEAVKTRLVVRFGLSRGAPRGPRLSANLQGGRGSLRQSRSGRRREGAERRDLVGDVLAFKVMSLQCHRTVIAWCEANDKRLTCAGQLGTIIGAKEKAKSHLACPQRECIVDLPG